MSMPTSLSDAARDAKVQIGVAAALLLLYVLTKQPIFGILTAIAIVALVIFEVYEGIKANGFRHELWETGITVGIAVLAWFALSFVLSTPTPISAVVSCSMVPELYRGDMILVQGGAAHSANLISVSPGDSQYLFSNPTVSFNGKSMTVNSSMYGYCYESGDVATCSLFNNNPSAFVEQRGPFTFTYGKCLRQSLSGNSIMVQEPCVMGLSYKNQSVDVQGDRSSDTVLYAPKPTDLFALSGDIVHRAVVEIKDGSSAYFLTKGDNNNVFDIQFHSLAYERFNTPVSPEQLKGKVLFHVPWLGYYKLFLVGFVTEDAVCGTKLSSYSFVE
jgi:signal peptidase I